MDRRDLLQLPAVKFAIFSINGLPTKAFTMAGKQLVVFVNENVMNMEWYEAHMKPRQLESMRMSW
jgi:hypothetical protein